MAEPEPKVISPPASKVSWPEFKPLLVLKFQFTPALKAMLPLASNKICEKFLFLNAVLMFTFHVAELLAEPLTVPLPFGAVVVLPELFREMLIGSRRNSPPAKPVCALASIAESSDWMFGALTSRLPPLPPLAPPVVTI